MGELILDGVLVTPLKKIAHVKGDILHALKKSDSGFASFGEAYFSFINQNEVKGWKKHTEMILNIIVPVGAIRFSIYDDRAQSATFKKNQRLTISQSNYCRLTVPPGLWMAFEGVEQSNLLLNVASIEHEPEEAENKSLDAFKF